MTEAMPIAGLPQIEFATGDFILSILAGLVTAFILAGGAIGFRFAFRRFKRELAPFLGDYSVYHRMHSTDGIVRWKAIISQRGFGLRLELTEEGEAKFRYTGAFRIVGRSVYSHLEGQTHEAESFLSAQNPFNKSTHVDSFFGILCGVNHDQNPASTLLLFSRYPMSDTEILNQFSGSNRAILVAALPERERLKSASGAASSSPEKLAAGNRGTLESEVRG